MALDYVVVGAGIYGCVFARVMAEAGREVLVVDKRDHIGGNCFTRQEHGINVHVYGPHIFHTNNPGVWEFVNRFAKFNHFRYRGCVNFEGRMFSFPINLLTLHQVWGVLTPAEAVERLQKVREPISNPQNLEEWILSQVGRELYEIFVKGYTTKQWGRDPKELPASIIRRIPIRTTYNDRYFDDAYEGIPIGGYTALMANMLDHPKIRHETNVDYFAQAAELNAAGKTLVYTGKIDEFFGYRFGRLAYRSLRFENEVRSGDVQGTACVNYTSQKVPFTRITEHKHFEMLESPVSVITREYPDSYDGDHKVPYYPIRDEKSMAMFAQYQELANRESVIFGGRLGSYQYFDMHQVVAQAMTTAKKLLGQETCPQ